MKLLLTCTLLLIHWMTLAQSFDEIKVYENIISYVKNNRLYIQEMRKYCNQDSSFEFVPIFEDVTWEVVMRDGVSAFLFEIGNSQTGLDKLDSLQKAHADEYKKISRLDSPELTREQEIARSVKMKKLTKIIRKRSEKGANSVWHFSLIYSNWVVCEIVINDAFKDAPRNYKIELASYAQGCRTVLNIAFKINENGKIIAAFHDIY